MSEHPMFCVCDSCAFDVAMAHKAGDERFGRDWTAGNGCGCASCRKFRPIEASFRRIAELEKQRTRIAALSAALRSDPEVPHGNR